MLGAGLVLAALGGCCLLPETATLVILNESRFTVDEVYIAPVGSPDLGEDWLSTTILPGAERAFRWITPGTYDVVIRDTSDGEWAEPGLDLPPGERTVLKLNDGE